jgi:hypothetical protein
MAGLLIKFAIRLGDSVDFSGGPLFHRWLPRGMEDAIELETGVGHLRLWFERLGYTEENMVHFDFQRHEVNDAIVPKQGKLDAGPVFGLLNIDKISDSVLDEVRKSVVADSGYVDLGKRIVKSVAPVAERFIKILKVRYGQHWLNSPPSWDSRYSSLGAICEDWDMRWSDDDGKNWHVFKPDKSIRYYPSEEKTNFSEYLGQSDWNDLKLAVENGDDVSLSAQLVANSHRLLSLDEPRHALVEACSALEVAISETVRTPVEGSTTLKDAVGSFLKDTGLKARVIVVTSLVGGINNAALEEVLLAIELRNRVVHEGSSPGPKDIKLIRAVINVAAQLVHGPRMKFPVLSVSNHVAEPDVWARTEGYAPLAVR